MIQKGLRLSVDKQKNNYKSCGLLWTVSNFSAFCGQIDIESYQNIGFAWTDRHRKLSKYRLSMDRQNQNCILLWPFTDG